MSLSFFFSILFFTRRIRRISQCLMQLTATAAGAQWALRAGWNNGRSVSHGRVPEIEGENGSEWFDVAERINRARQQELAASGARAIATRARADAVERASAVSVTYGAT